MTNCIIVLLLFLLFWCLVQSPDQGDRKLSSVSPRESLGPKSNAISVPRAVAFRKFHVNQLENVSVLFADIVGFTKMSSNKTASHLVYLLNDLFGRYRLLFIII